MTRGRHRRSFRDRPDARLRLHGWPRRRRAAVGTAVPRPHEAVPRLVGTAPVARRTSPTRKVRSRSTPGTSRAIRIGACRTRRIGVDLATMSGDGSEVIWFSDPTGDESGRWIATPFEGGEWRDLLPGAPVGWPDGLAIGRHIVAAVIADRDGFAVYVSEERRPREGDPSRRRLDPISSTDFHVEGFDHAGSLGRRDAGLRGGRPGRRQHPSRAPGARPANRCRGGRARRRSRSSASARSPGPR